MRSPRGLLPERALFLVLALLTVFHITLLGQGALAWGDEWMSFNNSRQLAEGVLEGSLEKIGLALASWGTRPGEYILRMPASALQDLVESFWGLSALSPESLRLATAQNVMVSLLLAVAFWRVGLALLPGRAVAAGATIAFSLLASNQIWVRHLLPYDAALLVHLVALLFCLRVCREPLPSALGWRRSGLAGIALALCFAAYPVVFYRARHLGLLLSAILLGSCIGFVAMQLRDWEGPQGRTPLAAGLLSGAALSIYPAYYAFTVACGLILALSDKEERMFSVGRGSIRRAALFGGGVLIVMFVFEMLGRLGGISYLGGARLLSSTITQGSFEEGLVFLPKYVLAVDSWGGWALMLLALRGIFIMGRSIHPLAARVLAIFSGLYLAYGVQSTFLHRMVFTGRYARIFIPALVLLAAFGLESFKGRVRQAAGVGWLACSLAGFWAFFSEYRTVAYPADVLHRLGVAYTDLVPRNIRHDFEPVPEYNLPFKLPGREYMTKPGDDRFIIWNFALPLSLRVSVPDKPVPPDHKLIYEGLHFGSARASGWEGATSEFRNALHEPGFRLRVFRSAASTGS